MSAIINGTTSDLTIDSNVASAGLPIAMFAWVKPDDTTNAHTPVSISDSALIGTVDSHALSLAGNAGGDPARAYTSSSGVFSIANTSPGFSSGAWQAHFGLWVATNDRRVKLGSGAWVTNTESRTPSGVNNTTIGSLRLDGANRTNRMVGRLAEVAIWAGVDAALFVNSVVPDLLLGYRPIHIKYAKPWLVLYQPLVSAINESGSVGLMTAAKLTLDSADYPALISPHGGISQAGLDLYSSLWLYS